MQRRISRAGIAGLIVAAVVIAGLARGASADAAAAPPAAPTVEQRLADLEAYVTNGARPRRCARRRRAPATTPG